VTAIATGCVMRKARSNRGLTTDVVIDSKGQSFDKNVQPQHMHEGDVGFHIFSCLSQQHGEMSPSQLATASRELDEMVSAHKQALGLPQARSPYQPGMVIQHEDGYGVVEQVIGTALQIRGFNERGKTFTCVINLVGTSEVEGRFGIEGLVLEVAENSPSYITQAVALLLESKEAVRNLFLSGVATDAKLAVLDRLDCILEEYLAILRKVGSDPLADRIARHAKDDRAYVLTAIYRGSAQLLDEVKDQSLLSMLVRRDGRGLERSLGDSGNLNRPDDFFFHALDLIHDQDELCDLAESAHEDETRERAILKVNDDVKVREWIVKNHGATIQRVPEWTKRFSTWESGAINLMVMDTELLYNEGIFAAAAETGMLDSISYRAIVEKFERINPLSEKVMPYLMRVEDKEFIASKLCKWVSSQALPEVRKLAKEKLAAIRRGDTDTV